MNKKQYFLDRQIALKRTQGAHEIVRSLVFAIFMMIVVFIAKSLTKNINDGVISLSAFIALVLIPGAVGTWCITLTIKRRMKNYGMICDSCGTIFDKAAAREQIAQSGRCNKCDAPFFEPE